MSLRATPLAFAVLAMGPMAQTPPAWTALSVPGGVHTIDIQSLGKVIAYPEAGQVHAYSGFARRWTTATTGAATVRVSNDSVLAAASPTFHAFSAYTGEWQPLTLSPAAQVVNPVNQRNDSLWLVRDGVDIWAFNAFDGQWTRLVAGANATATVERHTAVVVDGNNLFGFSAFHGTWVPATAAGPASLVRAGGTTGIVVASGTVHGFSAQRNTWASHAAPGPNPNFSYGDDVALASDGGNHVAFSGLRSAFAAIVVPANATARVSDALVHLDDAAGQHWAYSAVRNRWSTLPVAVGPIVHLSATSLLLSLADRVHAYSAITGTTVTVMGTVGFSNVARAVGTTVLQDGTFKLFSAVLGQWTDAPADAINQPPELCDVGALFRTQAGLAAFSARTGRITRVPASASAVTHVNASSAILAAIDGQTLLVYDARRERWLSETLLGVPQLSIWRTTLTVTDNGGLRALGFGSFHGRLETTTLPQVPIGGRANSESGRLDLPNSIYGFSADPDVLTLWQYPDFHRVFVGGASLSVRVHGPGSGTGVCFLATRVLSTPVPLAGLGELELDPASFLLLSGLAVPMVQGYGELRLPVPDDPALRGLEVSFQMLVVPASGPAYLTQSTGMHVL